MAQYRGTLQGCRGMASRLGTKNSGLDAKAGGWRIGGAVWMRYNKEKDRDEVTLDITTGSHCAGNSKRLGTWYLGKNGNFVKC